MLRRGFLLFVCLALAGIPADDAAPAAEPAEHTTHDASNSGSDAVKSSRLLAGVAKVDITDTNAGPVNDPLYAKALVLKDDTTTVVLITVDAVAIGEIGYIKNDYLGKVRAALLQELKIRPENVVINASHCHGVVCGDVADRTVRAVREAARQLVPVVVGTGVGHEDRIMENRRFKLKNGRQVDMRHAYALAPDEEIAEIGPIDPQIGLLRLDKENGQTLAVVYQFACHPIQGAANGGNTADLTGHASRVIENNLSDGAIALFLQGCGGDINPIQYKDVNNPRDGEPLGSMLGLSVLQGLRKIKSGASGSLKLINEKLQLPRADFTERIERMQAEQAKLLQSLQGTSLNLKTFLPLVVKYELSREYPSYSSHRYFHEKMIGRDDLLRLDARNRKSMQAYIDNILIMEELTRNQTNLALLRKNQQINLAAGRKPLEVETVGLRVGSFVLITFPGELTVEIGMKLKKSSPHKYTFVSGYTNGYIYYTPTAEQLRNVGNAQEDCDCLVAPEWQALFESKVADLLQRL